jgi:3-methyladenine DNA glycosylase AlkC
MQNMAEPFKNMWNERFFSGFTKALNNVLDEFDERAFLSQIRDNEWDNKELLQRARHITIVLKDFLPADFKNAVAKIIALIETIKKTEYWEVIEQSSLEGKYGLSLEYGIFGDYVEQFGLHDFETSVRAIEEITQFTSCEGPIRSFIIKYPDEMMRQMFAWSNHPNQWVRRLSSEGCRPRLPWSVALQKLKENPAPIIPILENLKNDTSRFVRLSVANNLNDIAKDNPETVIDLAKKWFGESENTDWVIKHGCRTLLKQGNPQAMELFGFGSVIKNISVEDFQIFTPEVKIGKSLEFSFNLLNKNEKKTKIRLEYGVYYQKANGTLSKKVHKISEKEYAAHSITQITRKHSFKIVTTRVLHLGLHQVSVIINGNEFEKYDFELTTNHY